MSNDGILQPALFRVVRKIPESANAFTVALAPLHGKALQSSPGQFNMLYAFGIGEAAISMSGDPDDQSVFVHTIRVVGNVTRALAKVNVGDLVGVRGPFGTAWPVDQYLGRDLIVVAGGVGLAPLRSLLYTLAKRRAAFGRIALLYGARHPEEMLYAAEFAAWKKVFEGQLYTTVDYAAPSWNGNVGMVTNLIERIPFPLAEAAAYVCGPEIMMRFTVRRLLERQMAGGRIHLSLERNMKCAIGHCGHCQFVSKFLCKDGPVFPYEQIAPFLGVKEV